MSLFLLVGRKKGRKAVCQPSLKLIIEIEMASSLLMSIVFITQSCVSQVIPNLVKMMRPQITETQSGHKWAQHTLGWVLGAADKASKRFAQFG